MKSLPSINLFYWILIICANTLGETFGDLISQTLDLGYGASTIILLLLFFAMLGTSILAKNQVMLIYWLLISISSTVGTTLSDYLARVISVNYLGLSEGIGYIIATLSLAFTLISVFTCWQLFSKKIDLQKEFNKRTEFLYWIAIFISSSLGTAVGDLLAHDTPLGFQGGSIMLIALLLIVILLLYTTKISLETLYWLGIIITHPLGATLGDLITKPDGLNLGNLKASLIVFITLILVIIIGTKNLTKNIHKTASD